MQKKQQEKDKLKLRPTEKLYICLEELDFTWTEEEVEQVISSWKKGLHIADIADLIKRNVDEVFLLLLDKARKGKLNLRSNGIFGI